MHHRQTILDGISASWCARVHRFILTKRAIPSTMLCVYYDCFSWPARRGDRTAACSAQPNLLLLLIAAVIAPLLELLLSLLLWLLALPLLR